MIENWRYNRAISSNIKQHEHQLRDIFFDQELLTQNALERLGVKRGTRPSGVDKVGRLFMVPEKISNLRVPYAIEVVGMPRAGKTTMINRYLHELWERDERHKVALVKEGARSLKDDHGDLRYTDPFTYSEMASTVSFLDYVRQTVTSVNFGGKAVISDRGQYDRSVFRRTLFLDGEVDPRIMVDEQRYMTELEHTPIQMGAVIMMMTRPEVSMERSTKPGPVANMDFLPRLYEQYWRLHSELLDYQRPYRLYTCIDAEQDEEKVYERFKYAMDTTMNLHGIMLEAFYKAFPEETEKARERFLRGARQQSNARQLLEQILDGKVKIVGGDDMVSEDDVLDRHFLEGYKLDK